MGTISSGVGLLSGINTAQLIDQLIGIEARPRQLIEKRNAVLASQQVAFQDINAKLLVLKLAAGGFLTSRVFKSTAASSSNPQAITATSSTTATPGTYSFSVARLVSSQQTITRGFADLDRTPVGAGTLTFEFGDARLATDTPLSQLNGGAGVARGPIRITDRSGASALVDLSRVVTVGDVLEAINGAAGISVAASVEGDRLKLTDHSGAMATALSVANVGATQTAASLGLNVAAVGDTLTGGQINRLGEGSLLAHLNDGRGVRTTRGLPDFQLTSNGSTYDVNLDGVATLEDLFEKISGASGGNITATVAPDGLSLQLAGPGGAAVSVAAVNGSLAADDLGLAGAAGRRLIAGLNSRLLGSLNGGTGVADLGTIRITNRAGVATDVDLSSAASVADLVGLINGANAGVTASLNRAGNGLLLTDTTGASAANLAVADLSGTAAADLGLAQSVASARLDSGNLQFGYLSEATRLSTLNGGQGIQRGRFTLTDSSGASSTVDLTQGDEITLGDVIAEINSRGLAIQARINDQGDGILLEDTGPGVLALKVEESGSTTARDLGLLGQAAAPGEHLDGSFERTVTIQTGATLSDVAAAINAAGLKVRVTIINDGSGVNPYRLSLMAAAAGRAGAFVFDDGGLGLSATHLSEARDAVVFYGSADPAQSIAITSPTNSLDSVVPGVRISLLATSHAPVEVNVSHDDKTILDSVKKFVEGFNSVLETLNKYDRYDAESKQRGLLLGDSTIARVRSGLFRLVNNRNGDLSTQFNSLAQIGITVGSGAQLKFDEGRFTTALAADRDAVEQLFTFKETQQNDAGETVVTKAGIGVRIDELLQALTDGPHGALPSQLDTLTTQIEANRKQITAWNVRLEARKMILHNQFNAMERALADLQKQSASLASFTPMNFNQGGSPR